MMTNLAQNGYVCYYIVHKIIDLLTLSQNIRDATIEQPYSRTVHFLENNSDRFSNKGEKLILRVLRTSHGLLYPDKFCSKKSRMSPLSKSLRNFNYADSGCGYGTNRRGVADLGKRAKGYQIDNAGNTNRNGR